MYIWGPFPVTLETFKIVKTYLNPILLFSERFQVKVYTVMFKIHFINIVYTKSFTENIYLTFIK